MQKAFDQLSRLAKGSKWGRLMHQPMRYVQGLYFQKLVYPRTKQGRLVKTDTFFGYPMEVLLPAGMDIYLLGGKSHDSELRLAQLMMQQLQSGQTFVDIGAHLGYFTLLASKLVGDTGRVISIEAARQIGDILAENIKPYANIQLQRVACTEEEATLTFHEFPVLYSEYNTLLPEQYQDADWLADNQAQKTEVPGKRLDTILHELDAQPNLIKMDVEGAEWQVIKGMQQTIKDFPNLLIVMEYLQDARENHNHVKATEALIAKGFQAHLINEDGQLSPITAPQIGHYLAKEGLESDNVVFKRG